MSRRNREEKEKKPKLKVKWKTWMTVLFVILGVAVIGAVTVLGVYLKGGFDTDNVPPQDISFNFNNNDLTKGQTIEVDEDFYLTITSTTKYANRRKVYLSFDNNRLQTPDEDGYISNGSIKVPYIVKIGEPFPVQLLPADLMDENNQPIVVNGENVPWIKGGIPVLYAFSENTLIDSTNVKIAIDVPVYKTEILFKNSKGEYTNSIVKNERFTVETKFIPQSSGYLYSDQLNQNREEKRVKKSYYLTVNEDTSVVRPIYDDKDSLHFVAGDNLENKEINIEAYTFIHAKDQLDYEEQNQATADSYEYYYTETLKYLKEKVENVCTLDSGGVTIGEEDVGNFDVTKESQSINLVIGQTLKLFIKNNPNEDNSEYLGGSIISKSGEYLDNLLPNLALRVVKKDTDEAVTENLTVVGGGEPITINGKQYLKPILKNVNDPGYAYWELSATAEEEMTIEVVLIVNNNEIFTLPGEEEGLVKKFTLKITKQEEKPVNWTDPANKEVYLQYKVSGDENVLEPENIYLESYISLPGREHVFFAWFAGTGNGKEDMNDDFWAKVDAAIGSSGYIKERSGQYTVSSNEIVNLVALSGNRLTLYNTCTLSIYCATIRQGTDENGHYNIIEFTSIPKRIICEKSLYDKSLTSVTADYTSYANATGDSNEISIDQGNNLPFTLSFNIEQESLPVFSEEYERGNISSPKIYNTSGEDISRYFHFETSGISEAVEDDENPQPAKLTFQVTTLNSIKIEDKNGIYIGAYELSYTNGDKHIDWNFKIEDGKKVCVYKPVAQSIELDTSTVKEAILQSETAGIEVEQTLTEEGDFKLSIKVNGNGNGQTFDKVSTFLTNLLGENYKNVTIKDQKGKTSTLQDQWKFVLQNSTSAIEISDDGKSFVFRNTNSKQEDVQLIIQSNDGNATVKKDDGNSNFVILFKVTSQGITSLQYDDDKHPYGTSHSYVDNGDGKINSVTVSKYGAKSGTEAEQKLTLKDLVKFYCKNENDEGQDAEFTKIKFRFSPQYYTNLSEVELVDLFGTDGMISVYQDTNGNEAVKFDSSADKIKEKLASINVSALKFNKDFANAHNILFVISDISDSSSAVNTDFTLRIEKNVEVSSSEVYDQGIYAAVGKEITNTVTNYNNGTSGDGQKLNALFGSKTLYVVLDSSGQYSLSDTKDNNSAVGEYNSTDGKIKFYDFWDREERHFTVYFRPDGNNTFTINQPIEFVVKRNLDLSQINNGGSTFNLLDSNQQKDIKNFVSFKRIANVDSADTIPDNSIPTIYYEIDRYLDIKGNMLSPKENLFFDYNQKALVSQVTLRLGSAQGTILTSFNISIILSNNDIYSELAGLITTKTSNNDEKGYPAITQKVKNSKGEDVEYIMFDGNVTNWALGKLSNDSYTILNSQLDYNNKQSSIIELSGETIIFKTRQDVMFGVNNPDAYIAFQIRKADSTGANIATLHIPVIVSKLGYDFIVYNNDQADRRVENAIMLPGDLLEKGNVYNEITAGQLTNILSTYSSQDYFTKNGDQADIFERAHFTVGGIYKLDSSKIKVNLEKYNINKTNYINYSSLINKAEVIYDNNTVKSGNIVLNHLSTGLENVFVALKVEFVNIDNPSYVQTMYYLLKVIPDVENDNGKGLYAFNGEVEYVEGDTTKQSTLNLEELYNKTTLNENKKRFVIEKLVPLTKNIDDSYNFNFKITGSNDAYIMARFSGTEKILKLSNGKLIYKEGKEEKTISGNNDIYDLKDLFNLATVDDESAVVNLAIMKGNVTISYQDVEMLKTLKFINSIERVTVDSNEYLTQEQWSKYIDLSFSNDYSVLTYKPKTTSSITILIKHSYTGDENNLSVVGGEQYYTVVINEQNEVYAVRFAETTESKDYPVNLRNGKDTTDYQLKIELIKKDELGNTTGDTKIYDKLNVSLIEGEEAFDLTKAQETNPEATLPYSYTNAKEDCTLKLYLKDYIEEDTTIVFSIWTDHGYLATLTINLKANIEMKPVTTTLTGGQEYEWNNLFTLTDENDQAQSGYTVTASAKSGDVNFVDLTGGKFKVADLVAPTQRTVTIDYVITLSSGNNKFHFSQVYTLMPNITPKTEISSPKEMIAGDKHQIQGALFDNLNSADKETTLNDYTVTGQSSSPAFKELTQEEGEYYLHANYVSTKVTVEVTLHVEFKFNDVSQSFDVPYTIVVAPSVQLKVNYPSPNEKTKIEYEFVDDNAYFLNITKDFLQQNAIFSTLPRVQIFKAQLESEANEVTYSNSAISSSEWDTTNNYSITINEKSTQAQVFVGLNTDSSNTSSSIPANASIRLNRATTEDGNEQTVVFALSYQNVTCLYKVVIVAQALSVNLQNVSNNITRGEYEEETVDSETIYIDRVDVTNLFAKGRLIQVALKSGSFNEDNYYFVFEKGGKYYRSNSIYLSSANHFGKTVYLDLGKNFSGYNFVGLYLASIFENSKYTFGQNGIIQLKSEQEKEPATDITKPDDLPKDNNDMILTNSNGEMQYRVTQRLEMYYGHDAQGDQIYVDNGSFDNILKGISQTESIEIDKIAEIKVNVSMAKNDGSFDYNSSKATDSEEGSWSVSQTTLYTNTFSKKLSYYYMPTIDIKVADEASTLANFKEVHVWKEEKSIIELFGIKHITNQKALTASDFTNGSLALEVIKKNKETDTDKWLEGDIATEYMRKLSFTKFANDNGIEKDYILTTAIKNSSDNIYDWRFIPQGAKNDGDFLALRITYKTNIGGEEYTKDFYGVIKILPDYEISFKGDTGDAQTEVIEGITYVSNTNPLSIFNTTTTDGKTTYNKFTLNGENGLTIKHQNAQEKTDISISNFTITMPFDKKIDGVTYNDKTNLEKKLFSHTTNGQHVQGGFTWPNNPSAAKELTFNKGEGDTKNTTEFANVPAVVFGDQAYMIEGVDDYGFRYIVYFTLKSTSAETPKATKSIEIEEEGYFDIGLQYRTLSFSEIGKEKEKTQQISATTLLDPTEQGQVKLVTISGIDSWYFQKKDEASVEADIIELKSEASTQYLGEIYKAKNDKTVNELVTNKYFKYPISHFITITKAELFNGNTSIAVFDLPEGYTTKQTSNSKEVKDQNKEVDKFATIGDNFEFGNTVSRGAETSGKDSKYAFQMPRIETTDIFGGATSAKLTLVLTFGFRDSGLLNTDGSKYVTEFDEVYECPVEVVLKRKASFTYDDLAVRDGEAFTVSDKIKYSYANTDTPSTSTTTQTYINDTLEVVVPANGTVSFNMTLTRDGNEPKTVTVDLHSSSSFARTSYISMSEKFETNVHENDKVSISVISGSPTFYYVGGEAKDQTINGKKEFTVTTISQDVVYLDHINLLNSSNFYKMTKYYIVKDTVKVTEAESESKETDYYYRVSANYKVTGKVFEVENAMPGENNIPCLNDYKSGEDANNTTSVSTWAAQAFKCYYGTSNGDIETVSRSSNTTNSDYSMFYFMPDTDKDNDQSGMADIESNGDITLKQSLSGHYISVKVYLKVSGCQRGTDTFKNGVGNDNYPTNSYGLKYLLTLKLTATKTLKN